MLSISSTPPRCSRWLALEGTRIDASAACSSTEGMGRLRLFQLGRHLSQLVRQLSVLMECGQILRYGDATAVDIHHAEIGLQRKPAIKIPMEFEN